MEASFYGVENVFFPSNAKIFKLHLSKNATYYRVENVMEGFASS